MPHNLTTLNTIQQFYNTPLEEKEAIFIYSGWASILFRTKEKVIAFDIGDKGIANEALGSVTKLDLQLYSHTHWDHFSPRVIKMLYEKTNAPMIVEPVIIEEISEEIPMEMIKSASGENIRISDFEISSVVGIHPRSITLFKVKWFETSIFHGADSGYVDLSKMKANILFVPTGTPSPSCSPEEGLKMALDVQPKVAIAMHGTKKQMQKFQQLVQKKLPECSVVIPKQNQITQITI